MPPKGSVQLTTTAESPTDVRSESASGSACGGWKSAVIPFEVSPSGKFLLVPPWMKNSSAWQPATLSDCPQSQIPPSPVGPLQVDAGVATSGWRSSSLVPPPASTMPLTSQIGEKAMPWPVM